MIGRLSQRVSRPALLVGSVVTLLVLSQLFPLAWPLGRIFQGAILGAASGLLALGLVLVYRTARVINFAYGAMGSCAAQVGIVCYEVYGLPWLACVVIALLAGAAIGVAVDAVLARFRNAPRLVVTVATIGLLQVLIGLQFGIAFWTGARVIVAPFATGLSETSFTVGTSVFNLNDALLLAVVPVAVIGLSGFLLRTDAGKAVRAIADNSERAALLDGCRIDRNGRLPRWPAAASGRSDPEPIRLGGCTRERGTGEARAHGEHQGGTRSEGSAAMPRGRRRGRRAGCSARRDRPSRRTTRRTAGASPSAGAAGFAGSRG